MEKAKKNQNVVSDVEVKEEVEMMNEEVKENVVANEEEKEMMNEEAKVETVRRFCVECGKPMDIPVGSRVTICESCREAKKKATAERAHKLAMERKARYNLTTINLTLHEQVKEVFKKNAREKGLSLGDYLKELLGVEIEEVKQETDIA